MVTLTTLTAGLALAASPTTADELAVPLIGQTDERSNCGPTAAAMLLAAYTGLADADGLVQLRDRLGEWSWRRFPMRRFGLPGYEAGMSTPGMLVATLNRFGRGLVFREASLVHPWVPAEAYALAVLKANIESGRPVIALVQSSTLWGVDAAGLHWIVVRSVKEGRVVYNDPADERRYEIPLDQFWRAWRLDPVFRKLRVVRSFVALVADRPLPSTGPASAAVVPRSSRWHAR